MRRVAEQEAADPDQLLHRQPRRVRPDGDVLLFLGAPGRQSVGGLGARRLLLQVQQLLARFVHRHTLAFMFSAKMFVVGAGGRCHWRLLLLAVNMDVSLRQLLDHRLLLSK